jgi:FAD:protein FMN transferase
MMKPSPVTLSLHAMATRFELVLYGDDAVRLRAAGEEALDEVERLEVQLSLYRPDSEISWINRHAAERAIKVEPRLFRLLQRCSTLTALTEGAFDVTVGPLMQAWRFINDTGAVPTPQEREAARRVVGISHVELDEATYTIRFKRKGVRLDLGGYGKGYAIERAMWVLKENGITSALLHGGTSSVQTIGVPPGKMAWQVELQEPLKERDHPVRIELINNALSVSAIHGKSFTANGREYGHVIDPRTGKPVDGALAAAVIGPSASECEALSTALLVLGSSWVPTLEDRFPCYVGMVAYAGSTSIPNEVVT